MSWIPLPVSLVTITDIRTTPNSHLSQESLIAALRALRTLAEARSGPKHRDYAGLRSRDDLGGRTAAPAYDETQQPYDPATVLDLELMVELAISKPEFAAETW